jgi:hypothetical protein
MFERSERRRWPWGQVLFLLLISIFAGLICWNRPVKPLWVAHEGLGFRMIIGSSPDGEIACLESSNRLAVRDLRTGEILRAFDIPTVNKNLSVTTEDGKWILLFTETPELLVISLEDGKLRYPPIPVRSKSCPFLRDDGRYAIISGAHQLPATLDELIDLRDGKLLWSTKSQISYCGGHQDLVFQFDPTSDQSPHLITISDQRDLGPISPPEMSGRDFVGIGTSIDDRIFLTYRIPLACGNPDHKYLSARISDRQLVDIRDEPNLFTRMTSPDRYVVTFPNGQLVTRELHKSQSGRVILAMYGLASRWGLIPGSDSVHFFWQCTSSGRPVGPPIQLENSIAWSTKDGRYLVEFGNRLAVYSTPPRSRWPETAAVVALPWLLVGAWRRFRSRRVHSPSLAGPQPVQ